MIPHLAIRRAFPRLASILIAIAPVAAHAAPSTELAHEWFVPLESVAGGYALVDKETGQIRFHSFSPSDDLVEIGPVASGAPGVTGIASGFGSTPEHIAISSTAMNRIAFAPADGAAPTSHPLAGTGPITTIPLRPNPTADEAMLAHFLYGNQGQRFDLIENPLDTPAPLDSEDKLSPILSLQPLRNPFANSRIGVGIWTKSAPPDIAVFARSGSDIAVEPLLEAGPVTRLAPEVSGTDDRHCVIAWTPGDLRPRIITLPWNSFSLGNLESIDDLPFPAGPISPIPAGIPNAPDGVLITALDGTSAIWARVVNGENLVREVTFTPDPGKRITALTPVPNRGFLSLEGDPLTGKSSSWRLFRDDGSGWDEVARGLLSDWLDPTGAFSGMFWFDAVPLVDRDARLIQLDPQPDWTRKPDSSLIPATFLRESFTGATGGLGNPLSLVPAIPTGAAYLLTNQYLPTVSIAPLGSASDLLAPRVRISPDSGTYPTTVRVTADFNESALDVFWRTDAPDDAWRPYTAPIHIAYTTTVLFFARDRITHASGPILARTYTLPLDALLTSDSDNDFVPDFVEQYLKLSPVGGPDSDGDTFSDLEEILADSDSADKDSFPSGTRQPPYLGVGFRCLAQAFDSLGGHAASGEEITLHDLRGAPLARATVAPFAAPPTVSGQMAATLSSTLPGNPREWVFLSSPVFFNLNTEPTPPRGGREIIRALRTPANPPLVVNPTLTGTDLAADAEAWILAAKAAFASYIQVTNVTELHPVDTAIAALCEAALFQSLAALPLATREALDVPDDPADFTLFPFRLDEEHKTPLTNAMISELIQRGWDFANLLDSLDTGARASTAIQDLASGVFQRHVSHADANPFMPLPLDAIRSLIRSGEISDPADGSDPDEDPPVPARPNPYGPTPDGPPAPNPIPDTLLTAAKSDIDTLLTPAALAATKRPLEQWTVRVDPPTRAGDRYDYTRLSPASGLAWITDETGDRIPLERSHGLALGTVFTLEGYTDVNTGVPSGYHGIELRRVISVVSIAPTDNDSNANLLDDEWELFFFGQLGAVNPFAPHPVTGHSYLQYHAAGADPRSANLSGPVETLVPTEIKIVYLDNGNYGIEFDFPSSYMGFFQFTALRSADLATPFVPNEEASAPLSLGGNRWVIDLGETYSSDDRHFFRLQMLVL